MLHVLLRATESDEIQRTAVEQTAFHKTIILVIMSNQVSDMQLQHHAQAARDQTQAVIERNPSQQQNEMVQELHRIEQTVEQNVSQQNLHFLTQMTRIAERSMSEQRASLIMEAIQALHMRDESTAQQLRARDELNEQLNNQITSLKKQTVSVFQPSIRKQRSSGTKLTRVTEEGER